MLLFLFLCYFVTLSLLSLPVQFYDQSRSLLSLLYPLFSLEKKGILISCQSRSVVRSSVRPCVRPSITFLVNVSPPKPLEIARSRSKVKY